jgi:hypothetical protein
MLEAVAVGVWVFVLVGVVVAIGVLVFVLVGGCVVAAKTRASGVLVASRLVMVGVAVASGRGVFVWKA